MSQTARFEFRVHPDAKSRIETAAALTHESASDFARTAALQRAEDILRRQEATLVPPDFFDALLTELDKPIERNERFSAAVHRARDLLNEG